MEVADERVARLVGERPGVDAHIQHGAFGEVVDRVDGDRRCSRPGDPAAGYQNLFDDRPVGVSVDGDIAGDRGNRFVEFQHDVVTDGHFGGAGRVRGTAHGEIEVDQTQLGSGRVAGGEVQGPFDGARVGVAVGVEERAGGDLDIPVGGLGVQVRVEVPGDLAGAPSGEPAIGHVPVSPRATVSIQAESDCPGSGEYRFAEREHDAGGVC